MSGHTQGPWTQSKIVPTAVDDALNFIVDCRVIDDDIETAIANARLIAAAPDLLGELENCLDLLVTCFSDSPVDSCMGVAITKARAAIAKATREAT